MTDKIAEITEKIYNEGIVKAREDAEQILENAKNEAKEIILKANNEGLKILEKASIESEDIKKKTMAELRLSSQQFISNIKKQITNIILTAQTKPALNNSFNDNEFIQKIILTVLQNWNPEKPEEMDLNILLPQKNEKELSDFFKSKAIETLNREISFSFDAKMESGFKISPKNGAYIISFSDNDFENYFKEYVKEKTRKLLFEAIQE